ncbi:MAG: hypothetical protein AB7V46_16685 [Thermomicrobiales bacterium]
MNADGITDLRDAMSILQYLFVAGSPLPVACAGGTGTGTGLTSEQLEILSHFEVVYLPDGQGGLRRTLRITAANLQIVNGLGATNGLEVDPYGESYAVNGLGNLILGYEEGQTLPTVDDDGNPVPAPLRLGSHNVVLGHGNEYYSHSGIVTGRANRLHAPWGTVGGVSNTVASPYGAVLGGTHNVVTGHHGTVSGGAYNDAHGTGSTVSGGATNQAFGDGSTVGGGSMRTATGTVDWVAGSLTQDQ